MNIVLSPNETNRFTVDADLIPANIMLGAMVTSLTYQVRWATLPSEENVSVHLVNVPLAPAISVVAHNVDIEAQFDESNKMVTFEKRK